MPERTLTLPGSTDQFVLTDRPATTLTDRYRPLPDGMTLRHATVVRAHQVRPEGVVVAFFTDGPGTRYAEHVLEAFTAPPAPSAPARPSARSASTSTPTAPPRTATCAWTAPTTARTASSSTATPPSRSFPPPAPHPCRRWTPPRCSPTCSPSTTTASRAPTRPCPFPAPSARGTPSASPAPRPSRSPPTWPPATPASGCTTRRSSPPTRACAPNRAARGRLIRPDADGRYRIGGLWPWQHWSPEEDDPTH